MTSDKLDEKFMMFFYYCYKKMTPARKRTEVIKGEMRYELPHVNSLVIAQKNFSNFFIPFYYYPVK